jgi:hypothetical protein
MSDTALPKTEAQTSWQRMQQIAQRIEAGLARDRSATSAKVPARTYGGPQGVSIAVHEVAKISEEFDLVRACRAQVSGQQRKLSPRTLKDYQKKARRLEAWRPDPQSPPDLLVHCPSANSFYPYRAATRWAAEEDCRQALRQRDRFATGTPERREAVKTLRRALQTLQAYPQGIHDGIARFKEQSAWAAQGLTDPPASLPPAAGKRNPRDTKAKIVGPLNRQIPDWSQKVWQRLVDIRSPWLSETATMALTGCRPEETASVTITQRQDGALIFQIIGAKVSATKGQPQRIITVRAQGPEFAYLQQRLQAAGGSLKLGAGESKAKDKAAALGAAVRRAGRQVLGHGRPEGHVRHGRPKGYVRHGRPEGHERYVRHGRPEGHVRHGRPKGHERYVRHGR